MKDRVLFFVNDPAFFLSHRLPIALEAQKSGYDVAVATGPGTEAIQKITALGIAHHELPLSRSGKNLLKELFLIIAIVKLFRKIRPRLVHLVTMKPVIYGGIAARLAGVPCVVAAISGLGYSFTSTELKAKIVKLIVSTLFRVSLSHRNITVIFQNEDDRGIILANCGLRKESTTLIRGSGVDLQKYSFVPEPEAELRVTFIARLLKDKGIYEFVSAAKNISKKYPTVKFRVVGGLDPGNPSGVSAEQVDQWRAENKVDILGFQTEIGRLISESNIVVLPSYREGLPKVLVEAAACGRAVVTTDVPGCRDAITPGVTGILVPVKDAEALASGILKLVDDNQLRRNMGLAGRSLAESEFDIRKIVKKHLDVYSALIANKKG